MNDGIENMRNVSAMYEAVANMLRSGEPDTVREGVKTAREMLALCLETDDPEVYLDLMVALIVFSQACIIRQESGLGTKAMEKELRMIIKKLDRRGSK